MFLFVFIGEEGVPAGEVGGGGDGIAGEIPNAFFLDDDTAEEMLADTVGMVDVFQKGVVLVGSLRVTHFRLGVEKKNLSVFHSQDEIYVEERLLTVGRLVWN